MATNDFANFDRLPMLNHNSGNVDQAKLDKKRERNRIAASKCRQRKLEKIQTLGKKVKNTVPNCKCESLIGPNSSLNFATLEEQVHRLKEENDKLRRSHEKLRESLEKTSAQLDYHIRNGCAINVPLSREVRNQKFRSNTSSYASYVEPH